MSAIHLAFSLERTPEFEFNLLILEVISVGDSDKPLSPQALTFVELPPSVDTSKPIILSSTSNVPPWVVVGFGNFCRRFTSTPLIGVYVPERGIEVRFSNDSTYSVGDVIPFTLKSATLF